MMKTFRKWLLWLLVGIIVLVGTVYLLLVTTPVLDSPVERLVNELLPEGVHISFKRVDGDLLHTLVLHDVTIEAPGFRGRIAQLQAEYDARAFSKGRLLFHRLILHQPEFHLAPPDTTPKTASLPTTESPSDTLTLPAMPDSLVIPEFPIIDIEQLVIQEGMLQVDNPRQPLVVSRIATEIRFYLSPRKIAIAPRYFRAVIDPLHIQVHNIQFQLSGTVQRITLNQFEARADSSYIIGHGELDFTPEPLLFLFMDTSYVDVSLARKFLPNLEIQNGYLRLAGSYIGVPAQFKGEFFLQGKLDSLQIEHLYFRYWKRGSVYRLQQLQFQSNFGTVQGELQYSHLGRNQAMLQFEDVQLQALQLVDFPTRLNGELQFWFNRWDVKRLTGGGAIRLWRSRLGDLRLDSLIVRAGVKQGRYRLLTPSYLLLGGTSRFFLQGEIARLERGDLTLTTSRLNLAEVASRVGIAEVKGTAEVYARLKGPLDNPDVSLKINIARLTFPDFQLDTLHATANLQQLFCQRVGTARLHFRTARYQTLQFDEGWLSVRSRQNQVFVDSLLLTSADARVYTQAVARYTPEVFQLNLPRLEVQYRQYQLQLEAPVQARLAKQWLTLEPMQFRDNAGGTLELAGQYHLDTDEFTGHLVSRQLQLAAFNNFVQLPMPVEGTLTTRIEVDKHQQQVAFRTDIRMDSLKINNVLLGTIQGEFALKDNQLTIPRVVFEGAAGGNLMLRDVQVDGVTWATPDSLWQFNQFLAGQLTVEKLRLAPLSQVLETTWPIRGEVSAAVQLKGNLRQLDVPFNLSVARLQVGNYRFPQGYLEGRITPREIRVDTADVNFENTRIHLSGWKKWWWQPPQFDRLFTDERFLVRLTIDEDSLNFLGALNEEVDRLTGDIQIHATVGGKISEPQVLDGNVRVRKGTLYLYRLANPIQYIHLDAHMMAQSLVIDRFEGWSSRGSATGNFWTRMWERFTAPVRKWLTGKRAGEITASGVIDLSILERPYYNLQVKANQAYVDYFLENLKAVVSTPGISIVGRDTIWVTGSAQVEYGEVELNLKESEKNLLLSPTLREVPPYVAYNIELQIPGKFFIRNTSPLNTFEIMVQGDLQIMQPPREYLEVNGYLHLRQGKYFVLIENFDIQEGRINFVNPKELPEIYLVATKRKYDLLFELTVHGRINNPIKEFKIYDVRNPGEPLYYPDAKDQLALLMFGVPFSELQGQFTRKLEEKGGQVVTQALLNQIQNEARTFIGLDQIRVESAQTDPIFEEARLNPQTTLALGKFLSSRLYLEFRSPLQGKGLGNIPLPELRWEAGNQLYLEYRLRRNWFLTTAYEKTLWGSDRIKFEISWQVDF